jgi:DNA processing protein
MAIRPAPEPPRRNAPFEQEPGFYPDAGLWMYGNVRLLAAALASIPLALGRPYQTPSELDMIERETEHSVLCGKVVVTGIHSPAHQRSAIVPLRWGAPRILVLSGGFHYHLGPNLKEEPFRAARLWRYQFDERTDLVISRRAPDKLPTFAQFNPTIDRLIERITCRQVPGLLFEART